MTDDDGVMTLAYCSMSCMSPGNDTARQGGVRAAVIHPLDVGKATKRAGLSSRL